MTAILFVDPGKKEAIANETKDGRFSFSRSKSNQSIFKIKNYFHFNKKCQITF